MCVWSEAPLNGWLLQAIQSSGVEVISVGSPRSDVRMCLGSTDRCLSDLRTFSAAMHGLPLIFVGFGNSAARQAIAKNHPRVFTTEPWMGLAEDRHEPRDEVLLPGLALDGRFMQAADIFSQSGSPDVAQISSLGCLDSGSILARIQEAASILIQWMGLPERVSACVGGGRIQRAGDEHPDSSSRSFRSWVGSFALTCQFSDGRAGLILASNQHPAWSRAALACGRFGAVRVDDTMLEWRDGANKLIECVEPAPSETEVIDQGSLTAHTLRDGDAVAQITAINRLHCRSFVEAACLSAFTRESESPLKMAEIFG